MNFAIFSSRHGWDKNIEMDPRKIRFILNTVNLGKCSVADSCEYSEEHSKFRKKENNFFIASSWSVYHCYLVS
jgi:hypothetical protein